MSNLKCFTGLTLLLVGLSSAIADDKPVAVQAKPDLQQCTPREMENLQALLWMQTSAEYYAVARQTYAFAGMELERALADSSWTAAVEQSRDFAEKPPAVILDIDETVLDNSPFEVEAMKAGVDADWSTQLSRLWGRWVNRGAENAVPGAVEFIQAAQRKGVHVFLVSNRSCPTDGRPCPRKAVTQRSLAKLGVQVADLDTDVLFSGEQGWTDEKSGRRARIAERYRILMLFGDDFGDFLPEVRDPAKFDVEQRRAAAAKHANYWGSRWFMLPNPVYGSWVSMLGKNKCALLEDFAKHETKGS